MDYKKFKTENAHDQICFCAVEKSNLHLLEEGFNVYEVSFANELTEAELDNSILNFIQDKKTKLEIIEKHGNVIVSGCKLSELLRNHILYDIIDVDILNMGFKSFAGTYIG